MEHELKKKGGPSDMDEITKEDIEELVRIHSQRLKKEKALVKYWEKRLAEYSGAET